LEEVKGHNQQDPFAVGRLKDDILDRYFLPLLELNLCSNLVEFTGEEGIGRIIAISMNLSEDRQAFFIAIHQSKPPGWFGHPGRSSKHANSREKLEAEKDTESSFSGNEVKTQANPGGQTVCKRNIEAALINKWFELIGLDLRKQSAHTAAHMRRWYLTGVDRTDTKNYPSRNPTDNAANEQHSKVNSRRLQDDADKWDETADPYGP
jgi:hypothetical protein